MQYYYQPGPVDPKEYQRFMFRKNLKSDSFGIGLLLIFIEVFSFILSIGLVLLSYSAADSTNSVFTFLQDGALSVFLFFIPAVIFVLIKHLSFNEIFPFRHDVPNMMLPLILFGTGVSLASNLVSSAMSSFFDMFGVSTDIDMGLSAKSPFEIVLFFITVAIVPALVEEFTFRGVICGALEKYSKGLAILCSAILFALIHGNFSQIFFVLPVGLVLGYVRIVTGSMLPGMVIHCINNGISVFFSILIDNEMLDEKYIDLLDGAVMGVIAVLGIISAVILFCKSKKYPQLFNFDDANKVIPYREKMKIFWLRPVIIIFCIMMVLQSLLFPFIT